MTEPLRDKLIRCGWVTNFNADTLRDCWLERTGLTIQDDPFVEDACSTIKSIRSELLRSEP